MGFDGYPEGGDPWNVKNDSVAWRVLLDSRARSSSATPRSPERRSAMTPRPGPHPLRPLRARPGALSARSTSWLAAKRQARQNETGIADRLADLGRGDRGPPARPGQGRDPAPAPAPRRPAFDLDNPRRDDRAGSPRSTSGPALGRPRRQAQGRRRLSPAMPGRLPPAPRLAVQDRARDRAATLRPGAGAAMATGRIRPLDRRRRAREPAGRDPALRLGDRRGGPGRPGRPALLGRGGDVAPARPLPQPDHPGPQGPGHPAGRPGDPQRDRHQRHPGPAGPG